MDFIKALKALKRWKFTFAGVALVAFALIAAAPTPQRMTAPSIYSSQAKILLTPPSGGGAVGRGGGVDMSQSWFADPTILTELLQSEELLTRVQASSGSKDPWNSLRGMVAVEPISANGSGVKLFKLTVTNSDPKQSQKITRLFTEEFADYVQELSAREFASTRKFIEEMVTEAEQRRMETEERLMEVREKYLGALSDTEAATQQSSLQSQHQQVTQSIPSLEAESATLKAFLDGQTSSPPWTVLQNSAGPLTALEASVTDNKLKLEQAREVYTEDNENVVTAKDRLAKSEQLYAQGLKAQVTSLYNSKAMELQQLQARATGLSSQINTLLASQMTPQDRKATQKLERELSLWDENHLSLQQQLYQARVAEQSSRRQGSVNILERPMLGVPMPVAMAPISASKTKKLLMAIPFCLVLGAAAALLREFLSTSMKMRPRIEEALELPVIAVIPASPSELMLNWEIFKRPMVPQTVGDLKLAGSSGQLSNGSGKSAKKDEPSSQQPARTNGNGSNGHGHKEASSVRTLDDYRPKDENS